MDGRVKSLDGNQYAQVFSNGGFFAEVYPTARKADTGLALESFIMDFRVPEDLTIDGSKKQNSKGTVFMKNCRRIKIRVTRTEPERSDQNPAEGVIREVRQRWFPTMIRKRVPRKLWDYGIRWTTQVMQRTSTQAGGLRGACPLEEVTGATVHISEYLDFGFYDHVSFKENAGLGVTSIGRWLGVSHIVGGCPTGFSPYQKRSSPAQPCKESLTSRKKLMRRRPLSLSLIVRSAAT
jgi:hypothetical protein